MFQSRFARLFATVCFLTAVVSSSLFARKPITPNQDDEQQLRVILMTLSRNMMTFERSLPDFVCQEKLDQLVRSADDKVEYQKEIRSLLTGRQRKEKTSNGTVYD